MPIPSGESSWQPRSISKLPWSRGPISLDSTHKQRARRRLCGFRLDDPHASPDWVGGNSKSPSNPILFRGTGFKSTADSYFSSNPIRMFSAMQIRDEASLHSRVRSSVCRFFLLAATVVCLAVLLPWRTDAQSLPAEAFGPYNATFLADGPGLTKPLAPPPAFDNRTAALLDRLGLNQQFTQRDPLAEGRAAWTLAFWFHSSEPLTGTVLLAGIGDPSAEDARFIGVKDNRLALWLGCEQGMNRLIAADGELAKAEWHLAAAVSDGQKVTLYADGKEVASSMLAQGEVAARLEIASEPVAVLDSRHFGGQIAGLKIYREELTTEQVEAIVAAPPDFSLPTYEEASRHWPVQTTSMAGQTAPQDPSTLPRSKVPIQKPMAKELRAADLRTELVGNNPWKLEGGWKLAAASNVKATGEEISRPGFATTDWLAATVPGTVLTTMIDRGVYPDPDYGLNNLAIPESLNKKDYWYRVEFRAPKSIAGRKLTLTFDGINYEALVWLNGESLGSIKGAFIRGTFDVTNVLKAEQTNVLAVRVSPPPHPGIPQEQSIKGGPGENGGLMCLDGPTFVATEGWDWIPAVRDRDTGIWQPVTLTATSAVKIGDVQVVPTLPLPDTSRAEVEITVPLENLSNASISGTLKAAL